MEGARERWGADLESEHLERIDYELRVIEDMGFPSYFLIVADYVLLYTYLAALVDPDTSAGVVLVMAILAWVNLVVRVLFRAECWLAVGPGQLAAAATGGDGVE